MIRHQAESAESPDLLIFMSERFADVTAYMVGSRQHPAVSERCADVTAHTVGSTETSGHV